MQITRWSYVEKIYNNTTEVNFKPTTSTKLTAKLTYCIQRISTINNNVSYQPFSKLSMIYSDNSEHLYR